MPYKPQQQEGAAERFNHSSIKKFTAKGQRAASAAIVDHVDRLHYSEMHS